jgi:hypothetical protein
MTFESGENGVLREINGLVGVPVGAFVNVIRVANTNGNYLWYFDGSAAATVCFWAKITGESPAGQYSFSQLQSDGSTASGYTGTGAIEVHGRLGIPTDTIVLMLESSQPGTTRKYRFVDDSGEPGTAKTLTDGSISTPATDSWTRSNQGTSRGVSLSLVANLLYDSTTGELFMIRRDHTADADGHEETWGAEEKSLISASTPATTTYPFLDCATGLTTVARFAFSDLPAHDYLWIWNGTKYVKSYKSTLSEGAATSPVPCTVLMPTTPANCAAVNVTAFNDTFGGTLDPCKWEDDATYVDGSAVITSGKLRITVDAGNPKVFQENHLYVFAGDFTIEVDVEMITYLADTTTSQGCNVPCYTTGGTFLFQMAINKQGATSNSTFTVVSENNSSQTNETNSAPSSVSFRVKRVGSTISGEYNTGGGWTASTRTASNSGNVFIGILGFSRWAGGSLVIDVDNYEITE